MVGRGIGRRSGGRGGGMLGEGFVAWCLVELSGAYSRIQFSCVEMRSGW